jgi:AbiV family abortive infection protein
VNEKSFHNITHQALENSEAWFEEAKLLITKKSYGHANALLRFAGEEAAKAVVCWYVSEGMIPDNSKPVQDIFSWHSAKNSLILSLTIAAIRSIHCEKEPTSEKRLAEWKYMEKFPDLMEKRRQTCIYVDFDKRDKRIVHSPKEISEKETKDIFEYIQLVLAYSKNIIENPSRQHIERLKRFFSSLPKEAWKTGFIDEKHLKLLDGMEK